MWPDLISQPEIQKICCPSVTQYPIKVFDMRLSDLDASGIMDPNRFHEITISRAVTLSSFTHNF